MDKSKSTKKATARPARPASRELFPDDVSDLDLATAADTSASATAVGDTSISPLLSDSMMDHLAEIVPLPMTPSCKLAYFLTLGFIIL